MELYQNIIKINIKSPELKETNISELEPILILESVCCKKQQKKVHDQLLVCGIGDL